MNQPAPDWPAAPTPDAAAPSAPPAPMAAPPAPAAIESAPQFAPPAPAAAPQFAPPAPAAAPQFAMPASPEAALDVTAPLMPVGAPAHQFDHAAHPTSLAMPQVEEGPANAAMPTFAASMAADASPQSIGGVAAAHPADLADRAAAQAPDSDTARAASVDPTGQWWSPGIALVLAMAGLALQLVAFYAREQLPVVKGAGVPLTNFDRVVGGVPLIDGIVGQALGMLMAAGALFLLLYGSRQGLREPQLQIGVGILAGLALLALPLLPVLFG